MHVDHRGPPGRADDVEFARFEVFFGGLVILLNCWVFPWVNTFEKDFMT